MSLPVTQRAVAALLGATVVWRALSGVAALVRWLWLGEFVGDGSMALLLTSVLAGPVFGAGAGDAALRRGVWSRSPAAHRRRIAAIVALFVLPFLVTAAATRLLGNGPASLPLYGLVTLSVTVLVASGLRGSADDE